MPCRSYCLEKSKKENKNSCGKHLNPWYDFDKSSYGWIFDCKEPSSGLNQTL